MKNSFLIYSPSISPLFNPIPDLFHIWNLPCDLHLPIHHQGWGHHHAIIGDGLDVLDLDYLGLDPQFFDRLPRSILELVAFRSTHPQNFNLFHQTLPPFLIRAFIIKLRIYLCSCSLIAARSVSTEGTLVSLPDSSLNIRQENPATPWGCNSFPLIKTEGDPVTPRALAWLSSIF